MSDSRLQFVLLLAAVVFVASGCTQQGELLSDTGDATTGAADTATNKRKGPAPDVQTAVDTGSVADSGTPADTRTAVDSGGVSTDTSTPDTGAQTDTTAMDTAACPAGERMCGGTCVDVTTSTNHCGKCGNTCPGAATCQNSACTCPAGEAICGGSCVDKTSNDSHCGSCGNKCPSAQSCRNSSCSCGGGKSFCDSKCVDTSSNDSHCGKCNKSCGSDQTCRNSSCKCTGGKTLCGGNCVNTSTNDNHCGRCGNSCSGSKTCVQSLCVSPKVKTIFNKTNNIRSSKTDCGSYGVKSAAGPVRLDANLNKAARRHAKDMAQNNFLSHTGSDGSSFQTRIRRTNFSGKPVSENVAAGDRTPGRIVRGWKNSDGHCRNMMIKRANRIGIGVARNNSTRYKLYWVQVFGEK